MRTHLLRSRGREVQNACILVGIGGLGRNLDLHKPAARAEDILNRVSSWPRRGKLHLFCASSSWPSSSVRCELQLVALPRSSTAPGINTPAATLYGRVRPNLLQASNGIFKGTIRASSL